MMLAHAWQHDGALPLDPQRIRKIAKLTPEQWAESGDVLLEFWQKNGTCYRQKRTDAELSRAVARYNQQVDAGKARAAQRALSGRSADATADAKRSHNRTLSQSDSDSDSDSKALESKDLVRAARRPGPADPLSKPPKPVNRGTRLPHGWQLPDDWQAWAEQVRPDWTPQGIIRESITFRDYWLAKSGANGSKMDWLATWRNWIRRCETEPQR